MMTIAFTFVVCFVCVLQYALFKNSKLVVHRLAIVFVDNNLKRNEIPRRNVSVLENSNFWGLIVDCLSNFFDMKELLFLKMVISQ